MFLNYDKKLFQWHKDKRKILWISNDYEKINEDDKISITGLENFAQDTSFTCELKHSDGKSEKIQLKHSYNSSQIEWFKAGSALNVLKNRKM